MKYLGKFLENSQKSFVLEESRSQNMAWRGATPGLGGQRARPPPRPRPTGAWTSGSTPEAPFGSYFTPDEETMRETPIFQFPSRSRHHLCSSSGELIWGLLWPLVRGIRRHRRHHRHSIIPPCFPHPCVSNSLL